jgi:large subunit ribosomal protein L7/L12
MSKRLEALTEKRKQIDAQIQALQARQEARKRKDDTRRKIVIGGAALKLVKTGKIKLNDLVGQLSERDRKLFVELVPGGDWTPNETTLQAIADAGKGEKLEFNAAVEKLKALEAEATA